MYTLITQENQNAPVNKTTITGGYTEVKAAVKAARHEAKYWLIQVTNGNTILSTIQTLSRL